MPVSSSRPWSTVSIGKTRKRPSAAASTTSWRSIRCLTLLAGMITPCRPVKPVIRQASKKPSIFSLTPPIAWIRPSWSTEPAAEKAAEDQDTLGMERAAELDLALDVDDLAAPEPDAGGDAARIAERQ